MLKSFHPLQALSLPTLLGFTRYALVFKNITIQVPEDAVFYRNPNTLCLPASWIDIIVFYAVNYFAHAATVRGSPGEGFFVRIPRLIGAILFPILGLYIAIGDILSCATFCQSSLAKAARAGALFMVIRTSEWKPIEGDIVEDALLIDSQSEARISKNQSRSSSSNSTSL